MNADFTRRGGNDRVFYGVADRWAGRLILLFVVVAVPREMSGPGLAGLPFEFGAAAFFATLGWLCFRVGFRTQLTARSDHFELANLLTDERITYRDVASIDLDLLSVRITLASGRRIRVWGLSDSLMNTGGPKGQKLVDRLGAIVTERQTADGPEHSRARFCDWWVLVALFVLFAGAIVYRLLTQ
ncbi:hypothetical protein C1I95_02235 [Micromonospora craterilacus]|uniref:Uncharacterized protein n=1 Tax=Micromonospora craterilacus TaxID=1655439 RepID=A0A2W2EHU2_9ACTN|nr:hypothetical protein [Micromonospora craterilacus]PZG23862.1 hypothetical protein C1I95_02235 [Micromonospora craterilacus]